MEAHKGLGSHISFVRSISIGLWSEQQLQYMKLGGNKAFREFLLPYSVQADPPQLKYTTRASKFYRRMLKSKVDAAEL